MGERATRYPHWWLHMCHVGVVLLLVTGCLVLDGVPRTVLFFLVGLAPVVTISWSMRAGRLRDRRPWKLIVAGMGLLSVGNGLGVVGAIGIVVPGADAVAQASAATGFLALLSACFVVVIRHAPQDSGGVIDAALTGVGVAGPLWEFLLRPRLAELSVPGGGQVAALVNVLLLLATLGALVRITQTSGPARTSLRYLYLALTCTISGTMLTILTSGTSIGGASVPLALWGTGYLCLATAALHPSAAYFTEPQGWRREGLSSIRLAYLGAILAVNPIIGALPQLWGHPADAPLLSIGTLAVVGLVVTRIGQLLRQRQQAQDALAHQASHDELTGLPNRRSVLGRLDEELARWSAGATAATGGSVGVLYCDLDGFKPVNDGYGHRAGDEVLRAVAERLRAGVRPGDLVGRIGGDEFMVVCADLDSTGAMALRQRIQAAVGAPVHIGDGVEVSVGVTVGVALSAPGELDDTDALVAAADNAMYAQKRSRPVPVPTQHQMSG